MALSRLAALIAVLLFALSVPSEAFAGKRVIREPSGDAEASWDLTKITVDNGKRKLYVRLDYRGSLRIEPALGFLVNLSLDLGQPASSEYDADFSISLLRGSTDPSAPDRLDLNREFEKIPCRGLKVTIRPEKGIVAFVVPQRCFGASAGRVRIGGYTYRPRGEPDEADYIDGWSRWIARKKRSRGGPATKRCGSVSFRANTEFAAVGIRAKGVGCKTARTVARRSKSFGPKGMVGRRVKFRARGFRCRGIEADSALPTMRFRCTRGRAVVRFVRT